MSALAKTKQLAMSSTSDAIRSLVHAEQQIDDATARGEAAWRDLAMAVAAVYHGELWRQATVPTGAVEQNELRLHVPRPCKSFVEWCEVCREKSKSWGYDLLNAAAFSTVVENVHQARELAGLSPADAKLLVSLATEGGTKQTTAKELRHLRAGDAIAKAREGKDATKRVLRKLEQRDWIDRVEHRANGLRKVLRQEVGTEKAEKYLDQIIAECKALAA